MSNGRIYKLVFSEIYPLNVRKAEKKDPLIQNTRRLDKMVDEHAKGKAMDRILRR